MPDTIYLEASTSKATLQTASTSCNAFATAIERDIRFAVADYNPHLLSSRQFLVDSYTLFAGLQNLQAAQQSTAVTVYGQHQDQLPSVEACQQYARIASLYRHKLQQHLAELEEESPNRGHWYAVYTIWHLANVLYFPEDGQGSTPVGEDLLHWLNIIDPQPSRQDGLALAASAAPWDNEELFWSYLPRCLLRGLYKAAATLLSSLFKHPLPFVSRSATLISALLQEVPRSTSYNLAASPDTFPRHVHHFRNKVNDVIRTLEDEYDDAARWKPDTENDERVAWFAGFLSLLRLLSGDEHAVLDQAEDWKEALCAWSVLVRPTMIRDDVPQTMRRIIDSISPASDDAVGEAQESLLLGHTVKAIQRCDEISLWLATHLADLLDKMKALGHDPTQEQTFRDYFVLRYADQLRFDPQMWRLVCHYLSYAGSIGTARIRNLLPTVAYADVLTPQGASSSKQLDHLGSTNNTSAEKSAEETTTADQVIAACYEYGLDDVAAGICCDVADRLLQAREYGRATAYVVQAGNAYRMAQITESLIDEYIENGLEAFAKLVDALPTNLLRPGAIPLDTEDDEVDATFDDDRTHKKQIDLVQDNVRPVLTGIFAESINFLAQYRDFHAFFAQGQRLEAAKMLVGLLVSGTPPKRFWSVLLFDALPLLEDQTLFFSSQDLYELLRCLEEITGQQTGSEGLKDPYNYLGALASVVSQKKGRKLDQKQIRNSALEQLRLVRLGIARNLARCFGAGL